MNHYKWIVLKIQDLSTSEFVRSIICYNGHGYDESELFELSDKPVQYFVDSNDLNGLLSAKDIMESALNNIYEVMAETGECAMVKDEWAMKKRNL